MNVWSKDSVSGEERVVKWSFDDSGMSSIVPTSSGACGLQMLTTTERDNDLGCRLKFSMEISPHPANQVVVVMR